MDQPSTISHYEIEGELGSGGMGIVYKARDLRLNRTVALKVLPEMLSRDPEAKVRFFHEGRAASSLDHANICTIYEIGETEDGRLFIAMAYVDGQPLSDVLANGPTKLATALDFAVAIGEGLVHSHERGVVHRDMKPSNVMVTESNGIKILDFGLAKQLGATQLTVSGTTLGTAAYMSPEQAQGQRTDHRTDIWALGVILYEMVTGKGPFAGEYQQALTYAIVNEEPEPPTGVRTGVPMELDRIVLKALEKDPDNRYQHVADFLVDLQALRRSIDSNKSGNSIKVTPTPASTRGVVYPWIVAVLASIAAIGFAVLAFRTASNQIPRLSTTIETEPIRFGGHPLATPFALSPDGSRVVYVRESGVSTIMVLRALSSFAETVIEGTEGGHSPFFSPDGEWLGFVTRSDLKKIHLGTGNVVTLATVPEMTHGASWGSDGMIVAGTLQSLTLVPANGGEPRAFGAMDSLSSEESFMVWPEVMDGSEYVLYTMLDASGNNGRIWAVPRQGGDRIFITEGSNAKYLSSGHIVFPRDGSLWIAGFNADNPSFTSEPVVAEGSVLSGFSQEAELAAYDVNDSGMLAYVARQGASGLALLSWIDENQTIERISDRAGAYFGVSVSPNAQRIATTTMGDDGVRRVRVFDIARDMWTTLASDQHCFWPFWGLDDETVYMTRGVTSTRYALASQRIGSQQVVVHANDEFAYQIRSWIPGTRDALLQRSRWPDYDDFDIVRLRPGSKPEPLIATPFLEMHPAVSPNGKWLAYATHVGNNTTIEDPNFDVFVRAMDAAEPLVQVSQGRGWAPQWAEDGARLYYEGDAGIMVVDWTSPDEISPSRPRLFYGGSFTRSLEYGLNYDVGPDGRILVLLPESDIRNIRVVTDWLDQLPG